MCTGLEAAAIAGAVASAAGTAVQARSTAKNQTKQVNARNAALLTNMEKNKKLSDEAQLKLADRFAKEGEGVQETLDPLAQAREEAANSTIDKASVSAPIPLAGNLPGVVGETAAAAQGATEEGSKNRANALAATRAFGDLVFEKNLQNQGTGRDLRQINSFVGANNELLPIQQDLAQLSVGGPSTFGGNLAALGGATSTIAGGMSQRPSAAPLSSPRPVARPARF